jgi:hypothetical protein
VYTSPGHYVLYLDGGKIAVLLDNVPKSKLSSSVNEQLSLLLFSELVSLNDHKTRQETRTIPQTQPLPITPTQQPDVRNANTTLGTTNEFVKKNLGKILSTGQDNLGKILSSGQDNLGKILSSGQDVFNVMTQNVMKKETSIIPPPQPQIAQPTTTIPPPQQLVPQQIVQPTTTVQAKPLFCFNDLEQLRDKNILAICDFDSPLVMTQFDEANHLYILQTNGLLWRFKFVDYKWIKESSRTLSTTPVTSATIVNNNIIYQSDKVYCRSITSDNDWDVGPVIPLAIEEQVQDIQPGVNGGVWIFASDTIYYSYEPHVHHSTISSFGARFIHTVLYHVSKEQINISTSNVYCSRYVSGHLLLLDLQGQVHVWTPSSNSVAQSIRSTSPLFMTSSMNSYYEVLSRYSKFIIQLQKYIESRNTSTLSTLKKEAQRCRLVKSLEIFMLHDTILCITNQDSCLCIEPRTCTLLGQMQLPNEIVLDTEQVDVRSVLWDTHDSTMMGVYCGSAIYEIRVPPLSELLRQLSEHTTEKYHVAMIAKEWNLQGWYIKYLLDLILFESTVHDQQQLLIELCNHLENPSLVWTGTRSITEQQVLIDQLILFVNEQDMDKFTLLNQAIVDTLEKSLSISQNQVQELSSIEQSIMIRQDEGIEELTDIELYDMIETEPDRVLSHLKSICGVVQVDDGIDYTKLSPSMMGMYDNEQADIDESTGSLHLNMIISILFKLDKSQLVTSIVHGMYEWKKQQLEFELASLRTQLQNTSTPITSHNSKTSDSFQEEQLRQHEQQMIQQKVC